MFPSSVMGLPCIGNSARYSNGSLSKGEENFITIDNDDEAEFFAIEPPKALSKEESLEKEKQISVDPISLKGSTTKQTSFRLVSPINKDFGPNDAMPFPAPKVKLSSTSLPSSESSSPPNDSNMMKMERNQYDEGSQPPQNNLSQMQLAMDDTVLAMRDADNQRSISFREQRSSFATNDFDIWVNKSNNSSEQINQQARFMSRNNSKPPLGPGGDNQMKKSRSRDQNFRDQEGFKCGKLCLFLPRGKGKMVWSTSSTSTSTQLPTMTEGSIISRTASLERFECGSWSPKNEGESGNLFFDLPMELLRCSVSDMQSPVTSAFVFDDDNDNKETKKDKESRGVLKNACKMDSRKSQDSTRHVRFSTSSPTSLPSSHTSMSQARDDFEAFLEAQMT